MHSQKNVKWRVLLFILSLSASAVWLAVFSYKPNQFKIVACDVGQGDAILITQGKNQILVDGGPNSRVVDCLSRYVAFWDRTIELVVLTHPQSDHFTGLLQVFKRFNVEIFLANSLDSGSQDYEVLKSLVGGGGVSVVTPEALQGARVGLIYLDILHPTKEFIAENSTVKNRPEVMNLANNISEVGRGVLGTTASKLDPNDFSIVLLASYKEFDALLTGDIENKLSDALSLEFSVLSLKSLDYIKIPHHGSDNGITPDLLDVIKPQVAVISVGKNSYGHPTDKVLKLLSNRSIKLYRTDQDGDIAVASDGKNWWKED